MLEKSLRKTYEQICIKPVLRLGFMSRLSPTVLTCAAALCGIAILPLLVGGYSWAAFVCLALSGFLDTLDGSLARYRNLITPQGAALDIVCDRIVEVAVILGLYGVDPGSRGFAAILMLGSILLCVTSFLVVGLLTPNESAKSFHYSPGLVERAEAFIAFAAMIIFPSMFSVLAYAFSFLVFVTAVIRMMQFQKGTVQ